MRKTNLFIKYLKSINILINNLLEKNLNKLKAENILKFARSNKIFFTFVAVIVLFLFYLLIPTLYNQSDISKKLKTELLIKLNLDFRFAKKLNYNIFPRPHFKSQEVIIQNKQNKTSKIKNLKVYVSLENLFLLKNLKINKVILENANFNLDKKNYNFFVNLLDNDFKDGNLEIKNSNIFFRDNKNEILFINKIIDMKYYYDHNDKTNLILANNTIFNLPYELKLNKDSINKKIFSKVNLNIFKFQIENEFDYLNDIKLGKADIILKKSKSKIYYKKNNQLFEFKYFDKQDNPNYFYKGSFNINPFYSNLVGNTKEFNLSNLINSNALSVLILKTEILNNKNIDFELKIYADKIYNNFNFQNIILKSKIKEGLIDVDNTTFKWKNFIDFELTNSLIFVKNNELVLDGKLQININKHNEIYKYLLTPKKYRKYLKKIELNFSYNFDQKSTLLNDIKIDEKYNQNINKIMQNVILKENKLQNKIYLKNLLNEAIKAYAG